MRIRDVLAAKGATVATIGPERPVTELLAEMSAHNVGAMVVIGAGGEIDGIVSERDVVRRLHERGSGLLRAAVSEIMTAVVVTCAPEDSVESLTVLMTEHRIRHIPVVSGGALAGIVSIGDVVKSRIDQLEQEQDYLEAYITQG